MALQPNALVSLAEAKVHLGIGPGIVDFDARIEMIINSASAMIENYTKRKLTTQSYTQYFDGSGANKVLLHQWPVTELTAVYVDGDSKFDANSLIQAEDYALEDEIMVIYHDRTFPRGYRNIRVDYTAGLGTVADDNIPYDLRWACMELVAWFYNSSSNQRIGILSKGKQGESVSFEQTLPQSIALMLEPYMRFEFPDANVQVRNQ